MKFYGGGFSTKDLVGVACDQRRFCCKGLKSAGNAFVNDLESPDKVPKYCNALEVVWNSSCSSSCFHYHAVEVGRVGWGLSIYSEAV